jgi:hypothetical protein
MSALAPAPATNERKNLRLRAGKNTWMCRGESSCGFLNRGDIDPAGSQRGGLKSPCEGKPLFSMGLELSN